MESLTKDQEQLDVLLAKWEEGRDRGAEIAVEDLTAAPELAEQLRSQIAKLRAMDWLDETTRLMKGDSVHPRAQAVPAVLGGRYRLEKLIAEGGFAQVWRARDAVLDRPVAVKITTTECLAEAQRSARLKHHGIVSVHDVGKEAGFCFIVFDLIEGTDLAVAMKKERFDWRRAATIVAEVARHLQYAHEKCFIHRDIKPANILLDERGRPVLADFGIAITQCELMHEIQTSPGTLAYMSPEQLRPARRLDGRTDIYSLGVVLYELLAGRLPFRAETLWELRRQIMHDEPEPLVDVPAELARICYKCLAKDPQQRFSSAKQLAEELESHSQSIV